MAVASPAAADSLPPAGGLSTAMHSPHPEIVAAGTEQAVFSNPSKAVSAVPVEELAAVSIEELAAVSVEELAAVSVEELAAVSVEAAVPVEELAAVPKGVLVVAPDVAETLLLADVEDAVSDFFLGSRAFSGGFQPKTLSMSPGGSQRTLQEVPDW